MPYGTPPEGSAAIFYVGATSTPTIPLGGLFKLVFFYYYTS